MMGRRFGLGLALGFGGALGVAAVAGLSGSSVEGAFTDALRTRAVEPGALEMTRTAGSADGGFWLSKADAADVIAPFTGPMAVGDADHGQERRWPRTDFRSRRRQGAACGRIACERCRVRRTACRNVSRRWSAGCAARALHRRSRNAGREKSRTARRKLCEAPNYAACVAKNTTIWALCNSSSLEQFRFALLHCLNKPRSQIALFFLVEIPSDCIAGLS